MTDNSKILWRPEDSQISESAMSKFMADKGFKSFEEFYLWSTEHFEDFWREWLQRSAIAFTGNIEEVYKPSGQGKFFGGQWFPNLKLNYAQTIIEGLSDLPLTFHSENSNPKTYSKKQFTEIVRKLQSHLLDRGVGEGDIVAGLLTNRPEAIFVMLAVVSIGAIWSSCSPEFGVQGILDRFSQIKPKALFIQSSYFFNGKTFPLEDKNADVLRELPTLAFNLNVDGADFSNLLAGDRSHRLTYKQCAFNHPLYILFSSGTTGAPKCIVHSCGGALLQHFKELKLHCDLKQNEAFGYYSTTGWMMWNWMLSGLGCGARVHIYDGAPMLETGWTLWDWAQEAKLNVFGTSARFIGASRIQQLKPFSENTLMRLVLSTGSPLLAEDFDYLYSFGEQSKKIQVSSISGGTDIVSCFMLGNPMLPVRRGEIQSPGLGMAIRAFNSAGRSVVDEQGELVCIKPFPSMPVYFFNDDNNEKYEAAYFKAYPGVWHHGDYVTITKNRGVIVHGRSDTTLNPGGVRIGTAEIYRQVETHPDIKDSLVVGKTLDGDEKIILFVQMCPEILLTQQIQDELRARIKTGASPRHLPWKIIECPEVPYTLSGKKVELAVKKILQGNNPDNVEALANPASLNFFKELKLI